MSTPYATLSYRRRRDVDVFGSFVGAVPVLLADAWRSVVAAVAAASTPAGTDGPRASPGVCTGLVPTAPQAAVVECTTGAPGGSSVACGGGGGGGSGSGAVAVGSKRKAESVSVFDSPRGFNDPASKRAQQRREERLRQAQATADAVAAAEAAAPVARTAPPSIGDVIATPGTTPPFPRPGPDAMPWSPAPAASSTAGMIAREVGASQSNPAAPQPTALSKKALKSQIYWERKAREAEQATIRAAAVAAADAARLQQRADGLASTPRPACKFFSQGRCRKGDACPFSHEVTAGAGAPDGHPRRQPDICRYLLAGGCAKGETQLW